MDRLFRRRLAAGGQWRAGCRKRAEQSPQLSVWDVASRRQVFKATGLPNRVYISTLSPDNKTFAAGCDQTIWLYDIPTGTLREQIKTPHSFIRGLRFSPDGSMLASSGGDDGAIVLWDTATWQPKGTLDGHRSRVRGLSFMHDGKTLVSAGSDQAVLLWDVASRTQSGVLQQPTARPTSEAEARRFLAIAYAPDGQQVAAAGEDGKLSIYDLASGKVLQTWQSAPTTPWPRWPIRPTAKRWPAAATTRWCSFGTPQPASRSASSAGTRAGSCR